MLPIQGLLSKKLGMTQIFNEDGNVVPVTVLEAGPCTVLQVKTLKTDGYNAIQLGFGVNTKKHTTKAIAGHVKKSTAEEMPHYIREFRLANGEAGEKEAEAFKPGDKITVDIFEGTYKISATGITKGRGFTGMVKRWNKKRGPESHGSMNVRGPGGLSGDSRLTHIRLERHMPGHYGCDSQTVENLEVVKIDKNRNLLFIKGAVPGAMNSLITVYKTNLIKREHVVLTAKGKKKPEPRAAAPKK